MKITKLDKTTFTLPKQLRSIRHQGNLYRYPAVLFLAIIVLAGALRLWGIADKSFWFDEILTALDLKYHYQNFFINQNQLRQVPLWSWDHPPLFFILSHLMIAILGESEFSMRFVSLLSGIASVGIIFQLGNALFGQLEGFIAASLMMISAFHIQYSQDARPYSLSIFFMLLTIYFLYRSWRTDRWFYWLGWGLFTALGFYTSYFSIVTWAIEVAFFTIFIRNIRQFGKIVFFSALAWIAYIPWLPNFLKFLASDLGQGVSNRLELFGIVQPMIVEILGQGSGWILILSVVLIMAALIAYPSKQKRITILLIAMWILAQLGIFFINPENRLMSIRYLLPILPLWYLAIAGGISALQSRVSSLSLLITTSLLSIFFISNVLILPQHYQITKDNFKGVAEFLRNNILPGDTILQDSRIYKYKGVMEYYPTRYGFSNQIVSEWTTISELKNYCSSSQRAWYYMRLLSSSWLKDEITSWVQANWRCEQSLELRDFVLCSCGPSRSELERLIVSDGTTPMELANGLTSLGYWEMAAKQYEKVIQSGKNNDLAYRGLVTIAKRLGDWSLAIDSYSQLLKQNPDNPLYGKGLRDIFENYISQKGTKILEWAEEMPNLIQNGDFESGNNFYVPEPYITNPNAIYQIDTQVADSGNASLSIVGKSADYHLGWGGQFAIEGNIPYLFAGMVRAEDEGGLKGRLMYWENFGSSVFGWRDFKGSIDQWTFYWTIILLPPGQNMVNLDPMLVEGNGKVWVDNLLLIKLDTKIQ